MSRRPLPPRFSPGWPATPLSLFRRFVCFSGALPCACLPHFSAQSTDRRNGRTDGRTDSPSFQLFPPSLSLSGWNGSFSFSPHIEARSPASIRKGSLLSPSHSIDVERQKKILSARRPPSTPNGRRIGHWGNLDNDKLSIDQTDGPESLNRSLQLRSEWAEARSLVKWTGLKLL